MFTTDATHLQWIVPCNGSRLLPNYERPVDTNTQLRDEGNAWHWLAQECFEGRIDASEYLDGIVAYNGIVITPEMFRHVREYLSELWPGAMEVQTTWGIPGAFEIRGRADHIGWDAMTGTLYVDDGKYGYTIVNPENNWTLLSHAIGYCANYGLMPNKVVMTIHQPRPYHPEGTTRSWELDANRFIQLRDMLINALSNLNSQLATGKHCDTCAKLANCPARRESSMLAVDTLQHAYNDAIPDDVLADEIRLMRYAKRLIEKRLDALEDMGKYRVTNGAVLPGMGLERTYSNRQWKKGVTPAMLQAITGRDVSERKLPSPTKAKDLGISDLFIDNLSDRFETGIKLVEVDINKKMERFK